MNQIAFVVSGKSPKTMPGGLGAYAYNSAKILADLGYKVFILGFSSESETLNLDFAKLVHLKTPYDIFLAVGQEISICCSLMHMLTGQFPRVLTAARKRNFL